MKKKLISRIMIGFPAGIAMGHIISILISITAGSAAFVPCAPALVEQIGSETGATAVQALLCGLLGAAYASGSLIWEMERWSIAKQSAVYFLVTGLALLPVAYLAHWMEHSWLGFVIYFGIFLAIFVLFWLGQYLVLRGKIKRMNNKIKED